LDRTPESAVPNTTSPRRWLSVAALLAFSVVVALWLFASRKPTATSTREAAAGDETPKGDTDAIPRAPATPAPLTSAAKGASAQDEHAGHDHDRHPHPITQEHVRIQNDNQMLGALNDATDVKDPARLRQLVEAWKAKHHDDPEKYAEAYTVIADCLEFPGDESRARAKRFYDENRASTLRRHIRRHCF
jgi:type IV secretory pathway VirB10-like protein